MRQYLVSDLLHEGSENGVTLTELVQLTGEERTDDPPSQPNRAQSRKTDSVRLQERVFSADEHA